MKLTIIGAGPGGYETAVRASRLGMEVTIVSDGPVGGTCLNEGCIPTKSFCRNAEILEDLSDASAFGIDGLDYSFDFHKVVERKNAVVSQLRSGVEFLLKGKNITLKYGKASFKDGHTVMVNGEEIASDRIIIATGSYPASLPIPGSDMEGVMTSTEILDIESVPKRLCIIGAGVIGLEFASVFRTFGSEVTVLEFCKDILPRFDVDMSKRLKQCLLKKGIRIETSASVQGISKDDEGLMKVGYVKNGQNAEVLADKVLMAVGRRANVGSLNLSDAGIGFTAKGIAVNADMQTNVPNIYAIGDVNGGVMLAHVATFQGYRALNHISGVKDNIDFSIVPAAVFTNPEVAVVGRTEEDCKEEGIDFKCLKSSFRANGKAISMDSPEGFCKVLIAGDSVRDPFRPGQILGCHMFGAHSSDIIQEVCALMNQGASADDFRNIIHAHPTLGEVLQSAVQG